MSFTRFQAVSPSTSPWTKDLRHVTAVLPRKWSLRVSWQDPRIRSVKPKDRIKWWNIVPGDRIRLLGDPEGTVHEVGSINKLTNRVYLKRTDVSEDTEKFVPQMFKSVPYARCQLFVGNHQFPPTDTSTEPRSLPVFATRLSTSKPYWLRDCHRYAWSRYATGTTPRLPGWSKYSDEKILIPWPKPKNPHRLEPTAYDTPKDVVAQITYVPPPLPMHSRATPPAMPSAQQYIQAISKPGAPSFDPSKPVEVHLQLELSNPHSRAKKQARWQAFELYKRSLLQQFVKAELANLKGRTRREARAEATWKWRQKLVEERKAEMKRRWKNRGAEARMLSKKDRKERKEERIHRNLRNLALRPAANQVLPGTQPTTS